MKLVVGLGNPGRKYEGTRHNVGYMVLAELARRAGSPGTKNAFQGELGRYLDRASSGCCCCGRTRT